MKSDQFGLALPAGPPTRIHTSAADQSYGLYIGPARSSHINAVFNSAYYIQLLLSYFFLASFHYICE